MSRTRGAELERKDDMAEGASINSNIYNLSVP